MSTVKRVVVGLDGSALAEAALPYAEVFARANEAAVVLVRAVSPAHNPGDIPERRTGTPADDELGDPPEMDYAQTRRLVYEAERYLTTIAQHLRKRGTLVEVAVVIGEPAAILVEEAQLRGAEMIILSTHGRSGFGRWIYGSVADQVMRAAIVPVLLVPPACRLPLLADHLSYPAETPKNTNSVAVLADVAGSLARFAEAPVLVAPARQAESLPSAERVTP